MQNNVLFSYVHVGGGEINVDNIPAFDLDMMYASIHQTRRGSLPSNDSHLQVRMKNIPF